MLKRILTVVIVILTLNTSVFAATERVTPELQVAINKYKKGNYTGSMQDLESCIRKDRSNTLAMYYYGMVLTKVGYPTLANTAYEIVKRLSPNSTLASYASKGQVCLKTPEQCYTNQTATVKELSPLDKFVNQNFQNGLSQDLNKSLERQRLEKLRKEMNASDEVNSYEFKDFPDYSKKKSEKPSNDEIVAALRVLNDAGLKNVTQGSMNAQMMPAAIAQTPEMNELNMLMNLNSPQQGNNNTNNNNMMNMLPYLLAQNHPTQNGEYQQTNGISPETLQAIMFSSMMPNLDFGATDYNR